MALPYTWPLGLLFWIVFLWAFAPEFALIRRSQDGAARADSKDNGSLRAILMSMNVAMFVAFFVAGLGRFAMHHRHLLFYSGLALLIAGSLLRRHCWRMLGEFCTGDVKVRENQPVIQRGAYRWVRHPSYTGGIVMFIGIGVALGDWVSLGFLAIGSIVGYVYRVMVEERALVQTLGQTYQGYMRRSWRFIPFVI